MTFTPTQEPNHRIVFHIQLGFVHRILFGSDMVSTDPSTPESSDNSLSDLGNCRLSSKLDMVHPGLFGRQHPIESVRQML